MGFKLKAADGTILEIADGDFYFNTKERARRMCLNSLSSDARRVYACLELATMSWKQELAVIMAPDGPRPLTPSDIKQQTGLSRQHVTTGLVELEHAGLAERRSRDGGALRKGQVLIYSFAVPRPPKKEDCTRAQVQFPDWFPESWEPLKPLISRFKYSITADEETARGYKDEGDAAARGYKDAAIVAERFLEKVCAGRKAARPSLYVKNLKNNTERTSSSAFDSSRKRGEDRNRGANNAEEDGQTFYERFKAQYPDGHFDEDNAKPLFEGKTLTEQAHILDRLQVYLTCERWQDAGGRWIKLASNWLEVYDADPPPAFSKANTKSTTRAAADAFFAEADA